MIPSVVLGFCASSEEWIIVLLGSSPISRHNGFLALRGGHLYRHKAHFWFMTVLFRHSALAPRLPRVQETFRSTGLSTNFHQSFLARVARQIWNSRLPQRRGFVLPAVGSTPKGAFQAFYPSRRSWFSLLVLCLVRLVVSMLERSHPLACRVEGIRRFSGSVRFLSEALDSLVRSSLFSRPVPFLRRVAYRRSCYDDKYNIAHVSSNGEFVEFAATAFRTRKLLSIPSGPRRDGNVSPPGASPFAVSARRTVHRLDGLSSGLVGSLISSPCVVYLLKGVVGSTPVQHPTETESSPPAIMTKRACLEDIKPLMRGDIYIGRGSHQRNLLRSKWPTTSKSSSTGGTLRFVSSLRSWRRTPSCGLYCRVCRALVLSVNAFQSKGATRTLLYQHILVDSPPLSMVMIPRHALLRRQS